MGSFAEAHSDYLDPDIHDNQEEEPLSKDGADLKMSEMLDKMFGRDGLDGWKKSVYKGTDCGAWIELLDPITIRVGSIVEGSDACAMSHTFIYPFEEKKVWDALEDIEDECAFLWAEANHPED